MLIELHAISKIYPLATVQVVALNNVDLAIERGEMVAIMGPSGSGKSTLMNILGCLDRPTSGDYILDGQKVSTLQGDQLAGIRNRKIGFVFQSYNLLSRTSAVDNVEIPLVYSGANNRRQKAVEALRAVGLADRLDHKPNELSGGEQQRVAIARALVNEPAIILADEPTGNLDSRTGLEIIGLFQRLNLERGITIIYVTHAPEIAEYTQRIVRLRDGSIVGDERVTQPTVRARCAGAKCSTAMNTASGWRTMSFLESLRLSLHSLRANKTRAALTVLGIVIGVASVISMLSIGRGARTRIESQINSIGSNLLFVRPGSSSQGGVNMGRGTAATLTYEDAVALADPANVPSAVAVSPENDSGGQIVYLANNARTRITGCTPDYETVHNIEMASGQFFSAFDVSGRTAVVVLGASTATELFPDDDAVGRNIRINGQPFLVVGVLKAKGGTGFGNQDDMVLVPFTTLQQRLAAAARFRGSENVGTIAVKVASQKQIDQATSEIQTVLRERHHVAL